jgi:hypothetical protein
MRFSPLHNSFSSQAVDDEFQIVVPAQPTAADSATGNQRRRVAFRLGASSPKVDAGHPLATSITSRTE